MLKASSNGFQALKSVCETEQNHYHAMYPTVVVTADECFPWDSLPQVHRYSLSIMRSDVGHNAIPVLSETDGNCLFRYYSTTTFCSSKLIFGAHLPNQCVGVIGV